MALQHLSPDAEAVNKLAQKIAQDHEQEYVGTEHILLAIVRQNNSVASRVLAHFGVDDTKVTKAVDEVIQKSKEDTWVFGRLPGSPHFRNVMAHAIEESAQLESKSVGSEHLLLALLRERGCVAERVLTGLGVTLRTCREEVVKQLTGR